MDSFSSGKLRYLSFLYYIYVNKCVYVYSCDTELLVAKDLIPLLQAGCNSMVVGLWVTRVC